MSRAAIRRTNVRGAGDKKLVIISASVGAAQLHGQSTGIAKGEIAADVQCSSTVINGGVSGCNGPASCRDRLGNSPSSAQGRRR